MRQVKRLLPYVRRYVQMAVYDVLDAEGAEYWKNESGAVVARLSVYGNVSTFSLSVAQYLENELMINRRCFVQDRHYAV